jgi:glycosyltransferase involved in cell wall biosynthesis
MISIIIPALNEEKYLPLLLESIKSQGFKDCEIIIADAGSKDKTLEIAKRYGCIVVPGGLPGKGRNEGAKVAKGDIIFFVDSDIILPEYFFDKSMAEFNKRELDIASFCLIPLPISRKAYFFMNFFYNQPMIVLEKILPHAAMGILVKKDFFEKLKGFDESIKLAEDMDFARRAKYKFKANFGIIRSVKIFCSDRRFKEDGWFATGIKFLLCELYMIFIGPVRSDIFKYKFDHHKGKKETKTKF